VLRPCRCNGASKSSLGTVVASINVASPAIVGWASRFPTAMRRPNVVSDPDHPADGEQRMPAESEEIAVPPRRGHFDKLRPRSQPVRARGARAGGRRSASAQHRAAGRSGAPLFAAGIICDDGDRNASSEQAVFDRWRQIHRVEID
jgi:hypothetical protein